MEASKFIKESIRMCNCNDCADCPAGVSCACIMTVNDLANNDETLKNYIAIVEKWSAEHPVITNLDKLVEIFGDETVDFLEDYLRFVCTDDDFKKEASAWLGEEYKNVDKA